MPSSSAAVRPTRKSCVSARACALRNPGICRTCSSLGGTRSAGRSTPQEHTEIVQSHTEESPSAHDSTERVMQDAAQNGVEDTQDSLPKNCALGIPLPVGHPVSCVPHLPETLDMAIMRSIQADNYKFVRHMIMSGWAPSDFTACAYSMTINRENEQEVWHVRQATPLHYAVCCGSLQAAAAILIAFPELAFLPCIVETTNSRMPRRSTWTVLDLTSFFGSLYIPMDQQRHQEYQQASLVLLNLRLDRKRLPFLHHETAWERLEAAGKNPQEVARAMFAATH